MKYINDKYYITDDGKIFIYAKANMYGEVIPLKEPKECKFHVVCGRKRLVMNNKAYSASELIASYLIPKPLKPDGTEYAAYRVEPIDGDHLNVELSNLIWSFKEVNKPYIPFRDVNGKEYLIKKKRKADSKTPGRKINPFYVIDTWRHMYDEYSSYSEAAKAYDISKSTVVTKLSNEEYLNRRYLFTRDISKTLEF